MNRALSDLHVAVLMGGISAERQVSLSSGEECAKALERQGARGDPAGSVPVVFRLEGPLRIHMQILSLFL